MHRRHGAVDRSRGGAGVVWNHWLHAIRAVLADLARGTA